ncbi:hypothetical protein QQX98_012845 [Neonectria punicea]|uniref:Uncharacterized protein n=1 Tax=Neonectria punicea TaxID=979145 RepID=A0ABR1GHN6_9HYPO
MHPLHMYSVIVIFLTLATPSTAARHNTTIVNNANRPWDRPWDRPWNHARLKYSYQCTDSDVKDKKCHRIPQPNRSRRIYGPCVARNNYVLCNVYEGKTWNGTQGMTTTLKRYRRRAEPTWKRAFRRTKAFRRLSLRSRPGSRKKREEKKRKAKQRPRRKLTARPVERAE